MKDVLLSIGSIVGTDIDGEVLPVMIIGKRQIHKKKNYMDDEYHYKAWDYRGVLYPGGAANDDFCYFNHTCIQVIYKVEEFEIYLAEEGDES